MNRTQKYQNFKAGFVSILKANPVDVKAAMNPQREEQCKIGGKTRWRGTKAALLLVPSLLLGTARASDRHPERKARDEYAQQFAAEIEHDGWEVATFAMRPGCPILCINHGEHNCLRIIMDGGTVEAVDRFAGQELKPRIAQMRALGFVEIDILGLQASHSYPNGIAHIPFPPETSQ